MRSILLFVALSLCVLGAFGSSHSEAPNTADSPVSDWTDLYAFRSYESSRGKYFTVLANLYGLQAPYGGPNYFTISDQFFYEIYFDTSGDCVEDFTFRFLFGSKMGGDNVTFDLEPADRDCNATGPTSVHIPGGITLPIGGKDVPIPLKTIGGVSASNQDNLNWFEYYVIDYVQGVRDSGSETRLQQVGDSSQIFYKPFDYSGTKTFANYAAYANQYIYDLSLENIPGGDCAGQQGKVFVGQRADGFYINLGKIFDLLNLVPIPGFPGAVKNDPANNDLSNKNVHTIALELPYECILNNQTVGIWLGTRRLFHDNAGGHIPGGQVSRLGNPLVNELVIGLKDKGKFSHSHPVDDAQFGTYVTNPSLPEIINVVYLKAVNDFYDSNLKTIAPTNFPRTDLVAAFLTGVPGLNVVGTGTACEYLRFNPLVDHKPKGSQDNMGVINGDNAGFPNGRRPGDDLVDIALRVVMGRLCHLNLTCTADDAPIGNVDLLDGAPVSDADFTSTFPYLNTPYPGATDFEPEACPDDGDGAANVVESTLLDVLEEWLF